MAMMSTNDSPLAEAYVFCRKSATVNSPAARSSPRPAPSMTEVAKPSVWMSSLNWRAVVTAGDS